MRPCEGNADFCDFAADYPRDIVPDPRFQATRFSFLCKHVFNPLVQSASLIKGKIFSSGSFDSSVNDVHGTKRFNIGGFGERKERACKVRPPRIWYDDEHCFKISEGIKCKGAARYHLPSKGAQQPGRLLVHRQPGHFPSGCWGFKKFIWSSCFPSKTVSVNGQK